MSAALAAAARVSSSETRSVITCSLSGCRPVILGSQVTIAEKILAAKSGHASVAPGEIVDAYPDLVMSHTATWRSATVMEKIGATKLYDPDRLAIVLDHIAPAKTEKNALDHVTSRNFA